MKIDCQYEFISSKTTNYRMIHSLPPPLPPFFRPPPPPPPPPRFCVCVCPCKMKLVYVYACVRERKSENIIINNSYAPSQPLFMPPPLFLSQKNLVQIYRRTCTFFSSSPGGINNIYTTTKYILLERKKLLTRRSYVFVLFTQL